MLICRGQKIKNITKIEQKRLFLFIFLVSFFNFVFGSFFELCHLLNLEQLYWKKILRACFCFLRMWFLIAIMKRCAERCALQLYRNSWIIFILCQLQSWIRLRVWTKKISKWRVIMEFATMKIFKNYIAGSLNNNNFPANESPSFH